MSDSSRGSGKVAWVAVILSFFAVFLDGFDVASLAFVVPVASPEWGVQAAAFTPALVVTNAGVVVGYAIAGYLCARFNQKHVLLGAVATYTLFTILVAITFPLHSIVLLSVLRGVTGVGLGITLPAGIRIATTQSAEERSNLVSVLVTLGLASGATVGSFFGGSLLDGVGTAGVFWVVSVIGVVLLIIMAFALPSASAGAIDRSSAASEAKVSRLFGSGFALDTSMIWVFSFFIFLANYTVSSWIPTVLTNAGYDSGVAPLGLSAYSLGGILGGLILLGITRKFHITGPLVVLAIIASAFTAISAIVPSEQWLMFTLLIVAGLGTTGCQIGQLALAVSTYDIGLQTTGVGWAAALGRMGSILGPAIGGALLGLAFSGADVLVVSAAGPAIAVLAAIVLLVRRKRTSRNSAAVKSQ